MNSQNSPVYIVFIFSSIKVLFGEVERKGEKGTFGVMA